MYNNYKKAQIMRKFLVNAQKLSMLCSTYKNIFLYFSGLRELEILVMLLC